MAPLKEDEFEKLQIVADKDTFVPETPEDRMETNRLLPINLQKWLKLYSKQNYTVKMLEIEKDELFGQLLKYYKFEDNVAWSNAKEIESQIYSNPKYTAKVREYETQKVYLQFILDTLNNIKGMNFILKNDIEHRKIMSSIL